jgi:hypothetical protein
MLVLIFQPVLGFATSSISALSDSEVVAGAHCPDNNHPGQG